MDQTKALLIAYLNDYFFVETGIEFLIQNIIEVFKENYSVYDEDKFSFYLSKKIDEFKVINTEAIMNNEPLLEVEVLVDEIITESENYTINSMDLSKFMDEPETTYESEKMLKDYGYEELFRWTKKQKNKLEESKKNMPEYKYKEAMSELKDYANEISPFVWNDLEMDEIQYKSHETKSESEESLIDLDETSYGLDETYGLNETSYGLDKTSYGLDETKLEKLEEEPELIHVNLCDLSILMDEFYKENVHVTAFSREHKYNGKSINDSCLSAYDIFGDVKYVLKELGENIYITRCPKKYCSCLNENSNMCIYARVIVCINTKYINRVEYICNKTYCNYNTKENIKFYLPKNKTSINILVDMI